GAGLVEAQAHGQRGDGELLLLGRGELDGLEQPVPELGVLLAEGRVVREELLPGGSAGVLGRDGRQDFAGMVVDALAAATGLLGLLGGRAPVAAEPRGGIGDPTAKRYGAHRDGSSWVCERSTTASMRSIPQRIKRVVVQSGQVSTWKGSYSGLLGRSPLAVSSKSISTMRPRGSVTLRFMTR